MDFGAVLKRERLVSTGINVVLSAAFFLVVFGAQNRVLTFADPDGFALDFLPQGGAISLMAALVPSLLVRKALRSGGALVLPTTGAILAQVARMVVLGVLSAVVMAAICLLGPWSAMGWTAAFALKLVYGGALGFAITHRALMRLYGGGKGLL
ncbi:hypothetical protein OVA07_18740 [Novosphingobium sp. SL115]|uniref:hypothetical protein n=1 Tax=Novosphingobium sp. SL115 TaxID=2995150 RepID=UPI002275851D|nr:hypothetical protein [Novosphingobium sp. SL115]MCY1673046.1 hypothetical protein [Novosphingobium sp. SL115]